MIKEHDTSQKVTVGMGSGPLGQHTFLSAWPIFVAMKGCYVLSYCDFE